MEVLSTLTGGAVAGKIDGRSVRRIVLEGGVASRLQIIKELSEADGMLHDSSSRCNYMLTNTG